MGIGYASFAAMEGVCDTPLHLFAEMFGEMGNGLGLSAVVMGVCDTPLQFLAEKLVKWELVMPPSPP